jgi:hypothetical protein
MLCGNEGQEAHEKDWHQGDTLDIADVPPP